MITRTRITDCFTGLVGWRESARAGGCYDALTDLLKTSNSGVYFNGLPGISLELVNELLSKDYDAVNDYLTDVYNDAVVELCNKFASQQRNSNYTKALLSNYDMGVYAQNLRALGIKNNRFVGFEIRPHRSNSINAQIIQFGGMFNTVQTGLPLYLYSDKQLEPLFVWYVDITKTNSIIWFDLNGDSSSSVGTTSWETVCEYINRDNGHDARYYLGYYEEDLTGRAINTEWPGWSGGACAGGCGGSQYRQHNQYVTIQPCEVPAANCYVDRNIFDLDNVGFSSSTYGLFMKMNVVCDISEIICDNKLLFANVLQKAVGIRILMDVVNSNNKNSTIVNQKQNARDMAIKYEGELYGYVQDGRFVKGEIEQISVDFSNIDPQCSGMKKAAFGLTNL